MQAHSSASGQGFSAVFSRDSLLYKLISMLVAWAMIMSSMPVYGSEQAQSQRPLSRDFGSNLFRDFVPATAPAGDRSALAEQASVAQRTTHESPSLRTGVRQQHSANIEIASLHAPAFLGNNLHGSLLNGFASGLFALPVQAADSPLQLSLAFADSSSASANFPEPWNDGNPLVNFVGGGVIYRAGAIRLDNPGTAALTVDSVTVDLGRPGPVFQLWQNVSIPAGGSAILTQTQDGNFNTSASPIVGCGVALDPNETRIPKITVTIGGASTDYLDTAHVLDTAGFDSSCRGNQSLEWRPIGTTGIESQAGSLQLIADGAPHAVGTQDTVTVLVNDASSQPLANVPVNLTVVNGPNAGKVFSGTSDASGSTTIQYSSSAQGTDLIQAVVNNPSTGVLQSQQTSTTWTSADICPSPSAPNAAASRLIYVGQTSVTFGSTMRVSALLTDGTGNPLTGRTLSFTVGGQNATATTDANGTATLLESSLPAGQSAVSASFAGDQSFQAAQLSATVIVLPAPTLLRYTGSNLITAQGQQTVSAVLTNSLGRATIAGRTLTFTLNGITVSAVTDANGSATATLNFATALPTGAGQLQINFAGDANYQPSSRVVPVQIYQPMPFVIWGGNSGGLLIGQRVNFWGSQWESQVINGLYYGANPSFKGWAGDVPLFGPCEADATLATLDMSCWQVKPGQSFPPDEVLPAYIEVVVSTAINKSGDTVFGNIACGAILAVDHTPPYGAVPGQDGYGTIAAVNGDCAGVFPKPAVIVGSQQQKSLVLPGEKVSVNYNIANQGATDATGTVLNENFDQVTPATATANLGTIAAGATATGSFPITVPAITPRQGTESSVDYSSRLAAQDGRLFASEGEISFTDPFNQLYTPADISSFSQLTLPRLTAGLSGPTCTAPNTTLPYQITLENVGSNTASQIAATLTLPDSTTATPLVPDLTAGTRFVGTVNWKAPGIAPKAADETTNAYLARLHASDAISLPAAVLSALWQDSLANAYGPVEQPFVTLTQRIPVVSTTTPATQALLPNQKTQLSFAVSNTGTGNAVQVTLQLKRPDGSIFVLPNFSLPGGQSTNLDADFKAPAVAAKGSTESDSAYISRLQSSNGAVLGLDAILSWTDPASNSYGPTDNPFNLTEVLPVLHLSASTSPAAVLPGQSTTLTASVQNSGGADAQNVAVSITNPDGTTTHPAPFTVAAGQSASTTGAFSVPVAGAKGASETDAAYLSRLQGLDGKQLGFNTGVNWSDAIANQYGTISAQAFATEQLPIVNVTITAPSNALSGDTISYAITLTNVGHADAAQVTGTFVLPDGTSQPLTAPNTTIPAGISVHSNFVYVIPKTHPTGTITASGSITWQDAAGNNYGPLNPSATTNVKQPNQPPVVDAGPNQTVPFPNVYPLQGKVTDDGLPNGTLISTWTQISGPSTVTFADPHSPTSTVFLGAAGTYVFRLTGDDSQLQSSADVSITTTSGNLPPVVTVGPDQTITLPVNTANIAGTATDDGLPAGSVLTFSWTKVSGPGTVTFANAASANTTATFGQSGTYLLRLSASDSQLTGSADMRVIVLAVNDPPVVDAGPNQTIIWPANTVTLAGIATDDGMPAGSVLKTNWAFVSGPTAVLFADPSLLNTTVQFGSPGTYTLRLTADDSQFRSSADVTITVRSLIDGPPDIISKPITQFVTDLSATPLPTYSYVVVATDPENDPLDYMLTTAPAGMAIDSATGTISWTPTEGDLGPHTVTVKVQEPSGQFDTQSYVLNVVTQASISPLGSLVLSPSSAGPVVVGTAQQLQAIFTDANNNPVANATITFTVTGVNPITGTAVTNTSGKATFVFSGTQAGVDSIVASTVVGSTTLNSNTSTISWVVPAQPISTTTINGRFFFSDGSGLFNTPPTATPAFVQNFPTINFNPPTGTVPGMPGSIGVNTRPFTDVTTDLSGNFTGSIVAQGNGLQAGVGSLFSFQSVFTGSYTVAAAGNVTFSFFSDDGFIFGINNGATRVSGSLFNPPPSGLTPFQGYPVMGAFNTATAPVANSITVHFPAAGTYQYEVDYSECCAGQLAITMTSSLSGNHGVPSSGTVTLSPGLNFSKSIGQSVTFTALLTDASGAIIPNVPVLFNVAGANTIQFQGVSDATGRATFTYQSFRTGTDIVQANAQITGMTAVSNQTLVTWNSATNTAPVVNAGTNQTITLPTNSATLSGKATDDGLPNGTLTTTWTQVSGPIAASIANPNQLQTVVSFTQPGTYVFKLTASDSVLSSSANVTITVNQQNLAPSISITVDSTVITQPANTVHVTGTVTDDGFPVGSTLSIQWTQVSGPAAVTFSNPNSPNTSITFPSAGTYGLKLSASDTQLTSSVNVTITVNPPAPNQAPTVTIAASQTTITLPSNVVSLAGRISDDGLPLGAPITTQWSQVSGPLPVTFSTPTSSSTQVGFPAAGTYVLQLAASDSELTGSATISITVNAVGTNQAPTVGIIADHTSITLPTNTVTLNGVVNDDGLPSGIITTQWAQISGPAAVNIIQITSTSVQVAFPTAGIYAIKLTASDGQLSTEDSITITVTTTGGNQPPTVSAGPNQSIQLPQNTVTLNGYAADDGLPTGSTLVVHWTEVSGPAAVSFGNAASAVTQASLPVAGVYVLQLSASDSQFQTTAQVTITVTSAPVPPPPAPVVSFTGFADGAEITTPTSIVGSVSSGNWKLEYSLLDGAGNPTTFVTFASGTTAVTNGTLGTFDPTVLLNGQYLVRFSSTDNAGQTASVTSTVDVSRNLKVGNFTLSFNDLSVPLPGLPITVTRTYDSRDKRVGDFGVGWTVSVANVRVQKTGGAIGQGWDEEVQWSGFFPTYCLQPVKNHFVTVTFPDGKIYKFQAVNTPQCQQIVPIDVPQIGFTQVPTGSATAGASLTPIGDTDLLLDGAIPGPVNIIDAEVNFADFTQFQLTTAEGFTYVLDQKLGATSVTDRNGNTLTINAAGITSSTGKSVAFTRDAQNRITRISDPNGASIQYQYNAAGDLTQVTDRVNQSTGFSYDTNHLLLEIVNPLGIQAVKNTFDDSGRLLSTTDANGNTVTYSHDVSTNHETVYDRLGNPTTFEYDGDGNVTRATDALGSVTTSTYDANDNKISETDALGKTSTYTYDALGNRLTETDPLGRVTKYTYNGRRQLLTLTDPSGNIATTTYDTNGNVTSLKDFSGNLISFTVAGNGMTESISGSGIGTTSYEYDASGNATKVTDSLGRVSTFTYDANGNQLTRAITRTTPSGTTTDVTTYTYDALNRLIKVTNPDGSVQQQTFDAAGNLASKTDARGNRTNFTYDGEGRLTSTSYPDATSESTVYDAEGHKLSSTNRAGKITTFTYDTVGRLTKTTFPDGASNSRAYDAAGHVASTTDENGNTNSYTYDDAGERTQILDALGKITRLAYDARGNLTTFTDARGNTTQFVYDANGHRTSIVHPDGTTDKTVYDAAGRAISKIDQAGSITQYTYDNAGHLTSVLDPLGGTTTFAYSELGNRISEADANNHITRYEYDALGRRTKRTLPTGVFDTYTYDAAGNVQSKTDFNGHVTTYTYDNMNRLLSTTPDPTLNDAPILLTYTATGKRETMTDASGTTTYSYDDRDRLLTKSTPQGKLTYTYDLVGNVASVVSSNSNGISTHYSYDGLNRLASVTDAAGHTTSYSYDEAGNLAGYNYANGVHHSFSYDTLNRLINTTAQNGVAGIASYAYTLDKSGNHLTVAELSGRKVSYGYDGLYRLAREDITNDPAANNGSVAYTYDAVGNRLSVTSTLSAIPSAVFSYDAGNRLSTDVYDSNGNTTFDGQTNVYDFQNHLVQRGNVTLTYDGDGNRVSKTVAGGTTSYLVDDNNPTGLPQVVEEITEGVVQKTYVYGLRLISETETASGTVHFYGFDGEGNVRYLTDESGAISDTYNYDAFGNLINRTGSTSNNYLYQGEQFDPDLGIYYLRARYLDQRTGRFLTADPFEGRSTDPVTLHRYLYCANNAPNCSDPSGKDFDLGSLSISFSIQSVLVNIGQGIFFGAIFGAIQGQLDDGDPVKGALKGALVGAILAPIAGAASAYKIGRIALSLASFGVGGYSAYGAWTQKKYGLAIFYAVTAIGGAFFSAFAERPAAPTTSTTPAEFAGVNTPPNKAVFWSGGPDAKAAADAFAEEIGGSTIGNTPGGQAFETAGVTEEELWNGLSSLFAQGAEGEVNVFLKVDMLRPGSTFNTVELPILEAKQAAGVVQIIFHRF